MHPGQNRNPDAREQILYREALALGLDKGDTIVKRRMAQKMELLFEDVAALREPTADELTVWFEKNSERFRLPARATFRHLYFSPDRRGPRARADAAQGLEKVAGQPADSPEARALADRFMFQDYYADRSFDDVAKTFGPPFARALFQITPGSWAGPIESGYGWHLVWVDALTPARVPPFDEVEPDVKTGWIEDQRTQIRQRAFEAMRARYQVVMPKDLSATDADIGLPQGDIPLALFAFNVGVECGQLAFVAAVLSVASLVRRVGAGLSVQRYAPRLAPYAIGTLAAFWFFQRLARF